VRRCRSRVSRQRYESACWGDILLLQSADTHSTVQHSTTQNKPNTSSLANSMHHRITADINGKMVRASCVMPTAAHLMTFLPLRRAWNNNTVSHCLHYTVLPALNSISLPALCMSLLMCDNVLDILATSPPPFNCPAAYTQCGLQPKLNKLR
jgi:hypothetical protein